MSQKGTRVIARFRARPRKESELREVLEALIEPTRAEPGCRLYELWQSRADPADLTFVEEWASDEALATHAESDHLRLARQLYPPLIEGDVELTLCDLVG